MSKLYKAAVAVAVAAVVLAAAIFSAAGQSDPAPAPINTDANVGKCLQAQQVLYRVGAGEAAETCLAQLDADGPESFNRTWKNYETTLGE